MDRKETVDRLLNGQNPINVLNERFTSANIGMGKHKFTKVIFDPRNQYVKPEHLKNIVITVLTDEAEHQGLEKGQSYRIVDTDVNNLDWKTPDNDGGDHGWPNAGDFPEGTLTLRPVGTEDNVEVEMAYLVDLFAAGFAV